ncbi:MAG TPA: D-2-hydroxyacid dehydrogenase [Candidatus Binataceae bacterium]|nr:D-2-hydroxyacid dehydrogenase [Candidatus Binataceae bacterium]
MKVLSTVGLTPAQRRMLEASLAPSDALIDHRCRSQAEMIEAAQDAGKNGGCEVLFSFRVPDELLRRVPSLKWVQLLSAGADHILKGLLAERGDIAVTTASGIHATPIAEYTIASMLAFAHGLHLTMRSQIKREWRRNSQFMDIADSLHRKTLGVIGYGSIGRETARIGDALGMPVLALKRNPGDHADTGWNPPGVGDPDGRIPAHWFGPEEREALLSESDYITVTLPMTPQTANFIGAREFAVMRPNAYLVNIGRGGVIDQNAMIEALKAHRIAGAGLDVFEREPLEPESGLWDLENVILTPHMSGAYKDYNTGACTLFADNLKRYCAGQPLYNLVDRSLGY